MCIVNKEADQVVSCATHDALHSNALSFGGLFRTDQLAVFTSVATDPPSSGLCVFTLTICQSAVGQCMLIDAMYYNATYHTVYWYCNCSITHHNVAYPSAPVWYQYSQHCCPRLSAQI